jgi:glycosyltransferase involved in cell wall biosynthesis
MREGSCTFHNLEWPPANSTVAGPILWLRGWAVGKPGTSLVDIRARTAAGIHLGVLGLPRMDLAAHFEPGRAWLPAEFVVGVPASDGTAEITVEAGDAAGNWHELQRLSLTVTPNGAKAPRAEGELRATTAGTSTERGTHRPFHGHVDEPAAHGGFIKLFGWVLHEAHEVRRVFATVDGLVWQHLAHGLEDPALEQKVPGLRGVRHARFKGVVELPVTAPAPANLRIYAELADGSTHLCFARRVTAEETDSVAATATQPTRLREAMLPAFPSGRPRRLLFVTGTLEPEEGTLRALDVVRGIAGRGQWTARLLTAEDGVLRRDFTCADCGIQMVDLREIFAAGPIPRRTELLAKLAATIWWKHLDAVVRFDEESAWIEPLARERGLPVFADPATALPWAAPDGSAAPDESGAVVAPVRALNSHGAGSLLRAADHLRRLQTGMNLVLGASGGTAEEVRFADDVQLNRLDNLLIAAAPEKAATLCCPGAVRPPLRQILAAIHSGLPVVTVPLPVLAEFGPNEVSLVPADNPLALAHALIDVQANRAAALRRAAAARRMAGDRHRFEQVLPRWLGALSAAIQQGG